MICRLPGQGPSGVSLIGVDHFKPDRPGREAFEHQVYVARQVKRRIDCLKERIRRPLHIPAESTLESASLRR